MDCKQADNLLIDFLYGELAPADRAAFEHHLQACPEHSREVEKLKGVLSLVRAQEPEEVPEALSARILQSARARLPQKPRPAPWLSLIWNPVAAAAVLALVVVTVGIATYYTSHQTPEEEAATEVARPATSPQTSEEPSLKPVVATPTEEQKELAPLAEAVGEAPPPAPRPQEPAPLKKARRKPAAKKRAAKTMAAPMVKSPAPEDGAEAVPGLATGARGGSVAGDSADVDRLPDRYTKPDRIHEGASAPAEKEKKSKDRARVRYDEEARFAQPPPQVAPAEAMPPASPKKAEAVREEPAAMEAEAEDSYSRQGTSVARKQRPADPYRVAEAYLADKRYDEAVSKYREFVSSNPSDPRVPTCRYRIAKALFLAGRCAEAVTAAGQAVDAAPRHPMAPGALLDQASCEVRLNRFSQAERTYRRVERDYPSYADEARRGLRRIHPADVPAATTEEQR